MCSGMYLYGGEILRKTGRADGGVEKIHVELLVEILHCCGEVVTAEDFFLCRAGVERGWRVQRRERSIECDICGRCRSR